MNQRNAFLRLYRLSSIATAIAAAAWAQPARLDTAIARAVEYLEDEVPRWKAENGCYSCHNDGDGARALLAAGRRAKIGDTIAFLSQTGEWQGHGQERGSAVLSTVQFASALIASRPEPAAATDAAMRVAAAQSKDGHWRVEEEQGPGSPATYGPFLGTYLAREVLRRVAPDEYRGAIARANRWLAETPPKYPVDDAAVALALGREEDAARLIARQAASGSWNGEVFDTALSVLALARRGDAESRQAVRRGAEFLLATQLEPGGWPGTTRPAGGQSYAQHISTSAWALVALTALRS
ncbi:MAG: hypothetical protein R2729_16335 [Bryobacteraceae bacterium]